MNIDKLQIDEIDRIADRASKIYAAALMYAGAGLYVVPIRPGAKAIPESRYGITYNSSTKNTKVIDTWFGPNGKFEGWNIGLACGKKNGIFVVDLDCKGGISGYDAFKSLAGDNDITAPTQSTPSGGKHLIFKWMPNGVSSTRKLGTNIDTRGGTETACKSHIVAWPSVIPGGEYTWELGGDIPEAPKWVTDGLGIPWGGAIGRGNENLESSDKEQQYNVDQIWDVLGYIDPSVLSYEEWLSVGQAINTQLPGEEGLVLWDTWSQTGTKYQMNECQTRWRGFNPSGPVRVGTLIWMAQQNGFAGSKKTGGNATGEFNSVIAELNDTYAVVMVGGKVRILAEIKDGNPMSPSHQLLTKDDFGLLLMNQKVVITDAKGNPKVVPKSIIWLADEDRRSYINGITFDPSKPKEFDGMYNLWEGFATEPYEGEWSKIAWHLKHIICGGNDDHYEWLLDWIADMLQEPANPKGCAIVMKGPEGAGKGTLAYMLGAMFGIHYRHVVHERHLVGNFNAHLANAVLVFADEVLYGGSKKIAGALKSLVTEKQLMVEKKGLDAYSYQNCVHLLIASNEDWFIPAGPHSRRWFVLDVSGDRVGNRSYFQALHKEMDNGGVAGFMDAMMKRQITANLNKAPITKLLLEQRSMSSSSDPIVAWWSEVIESGTIRCEHITATPVASRVEWPPMVDKFALYQRFVEWTLARAVRYNQGSGHFYSKMMSFGLKEARPRVGNNRPKCFEVPPPREAIVKLGEAAGVLLEQDFTEE